MDPSAAEHRGGQEASPSVGASSVAARIRTLISTLEGTGSDVGDAIEQLVKHVEWDAVDHRLVADTLAALFSASRPEVQAAMSTSLKTEQRYADHEVASHRVYSTVYGATKSELLANRAVEELGEP